MVIDSVTITQPPELILTTSAINSSCGNGDGSATVTATGGTSPYTYLWSNDSTTSNITLLTSNIYSVTVTDFNGCFQLASVMVSDAGGPTLTITDTVHNLCNGDSSGSAIATASGGTTPYTYLWSNGNTTSNLTLQTSNVYCVTVTDNLGCSSSTCVTITEPPLLSITTTQQNINCFGDSTGSATVNASGGTSPYSYLWSNLSGFQNLTGLVAGTYSVTAIDNNGCTATDSVTITQPTQLTALVSGTDSICNGNTGSATVTASGGTSPYTYLWSNGEATSNITLQTANVYSVTVSDAFGCTATDSISIIVNTVTANAGTDVTICLGDTVTLTATGGNSYNWNNGVIQGVPFSPANTATYTVTVTDSNGCTDTDNVIVTVSSMQLYFQTNYTISPTDTSGTILTFVTGGTDPLSFLWSNGQSNIGIGDLVAGTYYVTVTDANGCVATGSAEVPMYNVVLTDDSTYTPEQLVSDILIKGCVPVSNVEYSGAPEQIGYFYPSIPPPVSNFPLTDGIVMSTGNIVDVQGPNNSDGTSDALNSIIEPDCQTLVNMIGMNEYVFESTVLEFDFVPSSDTVQFRYIFGSDEFYEFCWSGFNDVFGFFISGPGISGPFSNNAKNIAVLPGTNTPVSIDLLCDNETILHDNQFFYYYEGDTVVPVEADAYTIVLTAKTAVQACETYHIKLATCDVGDDWLDSWVFLEKESFSTNGMVLMDNQGGHNLSEGCNDFYVISRYDTADLSDSVEVLLSYSGTATQGSDISSMPTSFYIPAGQVSDTIFFSALNDTIIDNWEYLVVTMLNGCECIQGTTNDTIFIYEFSGDINNNEQLICNLQDSLMLSAWAGYNNGVLSFQWNNGGSSDTITVFPQLGENEYIVTISNNCGTSISDSVLIKASDLSQTGVNYLQGLCDNNCSYSVELSPSGGVVPYQYLWYPTVTGELINGVIDSLCIGTYSLITTDSLGCNDTVAVIINPEPINITLDTLINVNCYNTATGSILLIADTITTVNYVWNTIPEETGTIITALTAGEYIVTASDSIRCTAIDTFIINQPLYIDPTIISDDSVYCINSLQVILQAVDSLGLWSGNGIVNDSIGLFSPSLAGLGSHQIIFTTYNNCDADTLTIFIDSIPQVSLGNDTNICIGQSILLSAGSIGNTYLWQDSTTSNSLLVSATGLYYLNVSRATGCSSADSVNITVNPLPVISLNSIDGICEGDSATITVSGGTNYLWNTGDTTNAVTVKPTATTTYNVTISDSNCSKDTSATVAYYEKPQADAGADKKICEGDNVQLTATGGVEFNWLPTDGLSNAEISNPIAKPTQSVEYIVEAKSGNCADYDTVAVIVNPLPTVEVSGNETVILGQSTQLGAVGGVNYF